MPLRSVCCAAGPLPSHSLERWTLRWVLAQARRWLRSAGETQLCELVARNAAVRTILCSCPGRAKCQHTVTRQSSRVIHTWPWAGSVKKVCWQDSDAQHYYSASSNSISSLTLYILFIRHYSAISFVFRRLMADYARAAAAAVQRSSLPPKLGIGYITARAK